MFSILQGRIRQEAQIDIGLTQVALGMAQYAVFRSPTNFADAEEYIPERWLPDADAKYAGDKREALQPFSFGPRNCIGRKCVAKSGRCVRPNADLLHSLANIEMRLVLAKMLWHFDFELADNDQHWIEDQMIYTTVSLPQPSLAKLR